MNLGQACLGAGALFGGVGVVLGAFGAHALKSRLAEPALQTWQTAVSYQLVHALALLAVGILIRLQAQAGGASDRLLGMAGGASDRLLGMAGGASDRLLGMAGGAIALGIVLFSGSLYLLALGGPRWLGPVTPLGGLAFIAGWTTLTIAALRPLSGP